MKTTAIILTATLGLHGLAMAQQMTLDSPELVGGKHLEQGSSYRFSNVLKGLDAVVTVDELNQASLLDIDAASSIGNAAWTPVLAGSGEDGLHYADFTVMFYAEGTDTHMAPDSFTTTVFSNNMTIPSEGFMMEFVQVTGSSSAGPADIDAAPSLASWKFDDKPGYSIRYGWQGGNGPADGRSFSNLMAGDAGSMLPTVPGTDSSLTSVPEPSTSFLFVLSVFPLAFRRKR